MPPRKPAAKKPPVEAEVPVPVKTKVAKPDPESKSVAKAKKVAKPEVAAAPEAAPAKPVKPAMAPRKSKTAKAPEEAAPVQAAQVETAALPPPELDARARAVLTAIHTGSALEFIFENGDANPPRTFEPRMLSFDALSRAWYAWGWDRRYNAERHHRLDLLKEINPVEGLGRAAQGPFKEGTPANLIGGWLGGEPIPVKAVLMKQWIFAVKQAPPPFPEFRMEDIEDGKALVTFTATDLRAIARWCMQFGEGIQVQEPQRLVDRIKQVGVTWGGKPRSEPEPARPVQQVAPAPRPLPPPPRREREAEEKPKAKTGRVEIRIERL